MPRTPETPPGECRPCLSLHKFHDVNGDGTWQVGEPTLPGIRFDVIEVDAPGDRRHNVATDGNGDLRLCWQGTTRVRIEELTRAAGGQWAQTGRVQRDVTVGGCGGVDLWVPNGRVSVPKTGGSPLVWWLQLWRDLIQALDRTAGR